MSRRRRLLIARHGQTEWNALGKLQGASDIPLDDVGRQQARELAERLSVHAIREVWASDLARATETAAIVATERGLPAPRIDPTLRERSVGIFEGLTRDEIAVHHPEAWQNWLSTTVAPPGGEPRAEAVVRMRQAIRAIASAATGPEPVLVVTHGGLMRLWLLEMLGPDVPQIPNGAVYIVDLDLDDDAHVGIELWTR